MRIVLDTNVWISALISPSGTPAQLLARLLTPASAQAYTLLISSEILSEIERVLDYPRIANRYDLTAEITQQYLEKIREATHLVQPHSVSPIPIIDADPTDDKFLYCAITGIADCIVSGDRHLKDLGSHQGIPVLSPIGFLDFLASK